MIFDSLVSLSMTEINGQSLPLTPANTDWQPALEAHHFYPTDIQHPTSTSTIPSSSSLVAEFGHQPGTVANPACARLKREIEPFLSPFAPENLLSRYSLGRPVPRQPPLVLHAQAEPSAYSQPPFLARAFRDGVHLYPQPRSGQPQVYQDPTRNCLLVALTANCYYGHRTISPQGTVAGVKDAT